MSYTKSITYNIFLCPMLCLFFCLYNEVPKKWYNKVILKRNVDRRNMPKHWYSDWPLYLILGISAFLHFFRIQTTEFDFDQANLFQLAHDAIAHVLIPLSSNQASIGVLQAPFFIYTLLPAAALSSNPLGGAITVALFSTIAAVLAYWFTHRYFGRLPAIV